MLTVSGLQRSRLRSFLNNRIAELDDVLFLRNAAAARQVHSDGANGELIKKRLLLYSTKSKKHT